MNYTTISSKAIVERVFGLLGNTISQDSDRFLGNVIEWIGSGIELIGILPAMERIDETFEVCNGKVTIPCNLYLINSVSYDGLWLPYGSQTFNYDMHCDNCVNNERADNLDYSYIINPNYLMTNVPDGETICISYVKYVTDKEGFPLIPDKEEIKQALFWKCLVNLMLGGFEHPNREISYSFADNQWIKYCGMASANLAIMDKPKLESFKRSWVKLFSDGTTMANNFYANTSSPEIIVQKYNNSRV
jgi:hypothetical protein